ncbi:hypothetical protein DFP72DRAFT_890368 [Ephemerocybe angulata]|uniref:RBR-type E3 ubiquitin transferase n=1 Tax=Ephemerocybe angulata TaxID=980116 RepID=A0A8H6M9A6_9AGAR|nr:hypothetical protein DFP72DRAFT_890368 [Tulosesus angulatus]
MPSVAAARHPKTDSQLAERKPTGAATAKSLAAQQPIRELKSTQDGRHCDGVKGKKREVQPRAKAEAGEGWSTPTQSTRPSIDGQQIRRDALIRRPPSLIERPTSFGVPGDLGPAVNLEECRNQALDQGPKERPFKAFGIEAYPTFAMKPEICIDFISWSRRCTWGSRCRRIHPRDKDFFKNKLFDRDSPYLFNRDLKDTPLLLPPADSDSDSGSDSQPSSRRSKTGASVAGTNHSTQISIRDSGWDPTTGQWDFGLDNEAWHLERSSSSERIDHSPQNSSDTEEEVMAEIRRSLPPRFANQPRDLCRNFQRGLCNRGPTTPNRIPIPYRRAVHLRTPSDRPVPLAPPPSTKPNPQHVQPGATLHSQPNRPVPPVPPPLVKENSLPSQRDANLRLKSDQRAQPHGPPTSGKQNLHPPAVPNTSPPDQRPEPGVCINWLRGHCWRGPTCHFRHPDLQSASSTTLAGSGPQMPPSERRYPRPPFTETCKIWLRGECLRGEQCFYVHDDLVYDDTLPPRKLVQVPARTVPEIHSTVIYKHIKIKVTEGFEIVEVVTGFETSWVYIGNVPKRVNLDDLSSLLKNHGELIDLRMPDPGPTPYITVKARFASAAEASKVCPSINGLEAFGSILTAKLSISVNTEANTHLNDTSVRISWEAPSKTAYVGFTSKQASLEALEKARYTALGKHLLKATVHTGLPAVSRFNIRLDGVPADTDTAALKDFIGSDSVMWGQANYTSNPRALNGIQRMVKDSGADVGWAHTATSQDAKKLCEFMHARKPAFTGLTRIFARHVQSLEYSLPVDAWGMGHLNVTPRVYPTYVSVRLGAEDTQGLSKLKAELDVILSGEVVREKGKVVWDRFFGYIGGQEFVGDLQRQHPLVTVRVDKYRKLIQRLAVRMKIMEKVEALRGQKVHTITLDSRMIGYLTNEGMAGLSHELGEDSIRLDLWNRVLTVRGDDHARNAARDAIIRLRRSFRVDPVPIPIQCPVCFDTAASPVTLCCGHSWCRTSIIEASFSSFIHRRPDEFSHCPTPDCQQIYRPISRVEITPPPSKPSALTKTSSSSSSSNKLSPPSSVSVGAALQCPSCLVRICASCQTEAHDGLVCVRPDEGDSLFEEWMKNNDVKPCPGCKMPIEKTMGFCSIHLCWVCLVPFHNGSGVYSHMLAMHGSFV